MGETILQAALRQGIAYPCGCQSGNCGACKSDLVSGEVEMAACSEYALTDAEKAKGLVLACRSVPWSDAEIAWLDQDETVSHPLRKLDCEVTAVTPLTHDINEVRLKIIAGGPFDFSPASMRASASPASRRATTLWPTHRTRRSLSSMSAIPAQAASAPLLPTN
ncbi:MAG: 2Fe-2S iron-sulfur cluster-binding protein [Minwuia sp.]|uniref:2Fe-2S iron-sulfur cluster-binding protein n=1 Tax=Minwuia sp. TaxID=2493630 RepID=UPI003A8827FE